MTTPRSIALALLLAVPLVILSPAHADETNLPNSEYRPLRVAGPLPQPVPEEITLPMPPGSMNAQGEAVSPRRQRPDAAELERRARNKALRAQTNADPLVEARSAAIDGYESELNDPNTSTERRKTVEFLIARTEKTRAEFSTSTQLWANLGDARRSQDPAKISAAKAALVEYLTPRLERKTGKKYPPTMSFEECTAEFAAANKAASPPPDPHAR